MFAVYHCRHMTPRISPIKRFAIDYFSAGIRICIFDDYVWIIWKPAFAELPRKGARAWFAGVLGLSIELGGTVSHVENNDAKLMRDDSALRRGIEWFIACWWMSQGCRVVKILMRLSACSKGRGWGLDQLPTSYPYYTIGCHTILSVLPWAGCVASWLNPIKILRYWEPSCSQMRTKISEVYHYCSPFHSAAFETNQSNNVNQIFGAHESDSVFKKSRSHLAINYRRFE